MRLYVIFVCLEMRDITSEVEPGNETIHNLARLGMRLYVTFANLGIKLCLMFEGEPGNETIHYL